MSRPAFSVIVNFYNNRREAARTLFTLSRKYQSDAADIDYEVIALDNGSPQPLSQEIVAEFGDNFRHHFHATLSPSPVEAINFAAKELARGDHVMIIVDGAHMLSPGVISYSVKALHAFANPFVATVAFHLGPAVQNVAIQQGYNQDAEDRLLAGVDWKANGYDLYRLVNSFADAAHGWFGQLFESSCFALRKAAFFDLGGLNRQFQARGGGLVNLDFFREAVARPDIDYIVLLGEGTFHQIHGGVSTNVAPSQHPGHEFAREYLRIRGKPYARVNRRPIYFGKIPDSSIQIARASVGKELRVWSQ